MTVLSPTYVERSRVSSLRESDQESQFDRTPGNNAIGGKHDFDPFRPPCMEEQNR